MDNALCGGAGATLTGTALAAVKAAIFMGDPHNVAGLPYNVGTCTSGGVSTYKRPVVSLARIRATNSDKILVLCPC